MNHILEATNGLQVGFDDNEKGIIIHRAPGEVVSPRQLRELSADLIELIDSQAFRSFEQKALPKKRAKRGTAAEKATKHLTKAVTHLAKAASESGKAAKEAKRGRKSAPEHREPPVNAEMAHPTADSRPHGPTEPEQAVSAAPNEKPVKTKVRHAKPKPAGPRVAEEE